MAAPPPLSRVAVERSRARVAAELGRADRVRLDALLPLIGADGRIQLEAALAGLFPGLEREAALTSLRQFRARIKVAAADAGINLNLDTDSQTRAAPADRHCWFAGEDGAIQAASEATKDETEGVLRTALVSAAGYVPNKRTVRYFVSYAHLHDPLTEDLLKRLRPWLKSASRYEMKGWQDTDILAGKGWHQSIQDAIKACDFGLLLLSPAFFASDYITREELRHFVSSNFEQPETARIAIPVALTRLRFDGTMDLKGLESQQVFRAKGGKCFQECSGSAAKDAFCDQLFGAIVRRLDNHFANAVEVGDKLIAAVPPTPDDSIFHRPHDFQKQQLGRELEDVRLVMQHGRTGSMQKLGADEVPDGERQEALKFLLEWARDPDGPPCFALLGSVGIGKTTTSKAFAHQLLELRETTEPALPVPIYLDLRDLGDLARGEPDLKAILGTILRRSWHGGRTEAPLAPDETIRLVREDGAIVIFDGLDEVLVHLSGRAGQQFTRELLRILPPGLWPRNRRPDAPGRPGRIMVTCRTHYFRSLREQQTHLTLEDRDDVRGSDYRTFVLLPFDDEQITDYLQQSFPDRETGPLLEIIRAVHNLRELAARPYTLSLIARSLPQIERWRMEGRRVTGVDLYRHMVLSWLERDSGKHEFDIDHKLRIMEYVAAELWRTTGRTWTARQMEDWLAGFLEHTPAVGMHYRRKDLEVLKKDLRTATFLVGGGRRPFRFAHTSLQEFFLAGYLLRALREGRPEDWDLPRPSRETFDFLGQMLLGEEDGAALAGLWAMRGSYRPRASEWVFGYILQALGAGYPAPSAVGIVLDGADLRDWVIEAAADKPLLALRDARLRGARLDNAVFRHVDLDRADCSGASGLRLEVNGGRAAHACFGGASLPGAVFRDVDLTGSKWGDAELHRTKFLRCTLRGAVALGADAPSAFFALCEPARPDCEVAIKTARLAVLGGHQSGVAACAFSPDSTRLLSGSGDNTLRLWDAASGDCLLTLQGHQNRVAACAFSPDGTRLLSGSDDNTLRLWDAASGDCLLTLQGHQNTVAACVFSPDGTRLLSGSDDNALRLWDAASGDCLLTLQGHQNRVAACAFSPDGTRLLSGSWDNTLRLWDAASGDCLLTLQGHQNTVAACAFSPDGTRLLSGSWDNTLRLWDAASGGCLLTLQGHQNTVAACAFSPDGTRLLSGSGDNTLRLWNAASGDCLLILQGHRDWVAACAFSPDSTRLLSGSGDNTLRLWDAASGDCLLTLQGHQNRVAACAFSPDGTRLLSGSDDNTLRLWDAASGDCLLTLQGHQNTVAACAFSPDGTRLLSGSDDNTLRLWDAASGDCLLTLQGHQNRVAACAFSPDGTRLLSGSWDDTLRLWDAASGDCLLTLQGHQNTVAACAFSPDGTRLLSGSWDKTLRLWDAASGDCLLILQGHQNRVAGCAFSPDGTRLLSGSSDKTLRLWNAASGDCLLILQGHRDWVAACAFSPDGSRLLSGSDDKTLRLWDAASGDCLLTLQGHQYGVAACAFSPDGTRLLSGSGDSTLRLWDASDGQPVGFRIQLLGAGAYSCLSADGAVVLHASDEAWRDLGWLVPDGRGGFETYPAEVFGPLATSTA